MEELLNDEDQTEFIEKVSNEFNTDSLLKHLYLIEKEFYTILKEHPEYDQRSKDIILVLCEQIITLRKMHKKTLMSKVIKHIMSKL